MRIVALVAALAVVALGIAPVAAQSGARSVVRFSIWTGNDDLRGGRDNLLVSYRSGGTWSAPRMLNRGQRWADNTRHVGQIELIDPMHGYSIDAVRLQTTFGGGMGGDNWNMASALVELCTIGRAGRPDLCRRIGHHGFKRFTGDDRELIIETTPIGAGLPSDESKL